jgi:hypothetical protein
MCSGPCVVLVCAALSLRCFVSAVGQGFLARLVLFRAASSGSAWVFPCWLLCCFAFPPFFLQTIIFFEERRARRRAAQVPERASPSRKHKANTTLYFHRFGFASRCVAMLCGMFVRLHLALFLAGGPFLPSL